MSPRRGVFLFILLMTVLGGTVLFAALRLRGPAAPSGSGTLLVFDLPSELEEGDFPMRSLFDFGRRDPYLVHEIVAGLDRAARDRDVRGLVLHVDQLDWGWAKAFEIRDAIQRFHDAGKPVYASIVDGGELEYLVASCADVIAMPPTAVLQLDGLTESAMFLKGALDKLQVSPNYAQAGMYKSAVEQYTRGGMSPPAREAMNALLETQYGLLVDSLATARGFEPKDVKQLLDAGPYTADDAKSSGLVDTLLYDAEVDSLALDDQTEDVATTTFASYLEHHPRPHGGSRIALITASGTIMPGKSRDVPGQEAVMGSETMIEALREARTKSAIKAVVLRIDSPGGSVQASDDIWREVKRLSDEKPLIVSMSDLAASGGYYIAAPARRIVAQPATLTGSIGVFGGKLNVLGLFQKLGVNVETLSRGKHAGMMSPYRDFTPEERTLYQQQIDTSYRLFLKRVVDGRGLTLEEADSVAQGRVWSGADAWELGLVDTLGGLETALSIACADAGLGRADRVSIETLPKVDHHWYEGLFQDLFDTNDSSDSRAAARVLLSPVMKAWLTASRMQSGMMFALMPWSIEFH